MIRHTNIENATAIAVDWTLYGWFCGESIVHYKVVVNGKCSLFCWYITSADYCENRWWKIRSSHSFFTTRTVQKNRALAENYGIWLKPSYISTVHQTWLFILVVMRNKKSTRRCLLWIRKITALESICLHGHALDEFDLALSWPPKLFFCLQTK